MCNKFGYVFSNSVWLIGIEADRQLVDSFIGHQNNDIAQKCRGIIASAQVLFAPTINFLK
jgi:hypothetical protein